MSKVIHSCPHCGSRDLSAYAVCRLNSNSPDWGTAGKVTCEDCHKTSGWDDVIETPVDPDVCPFCGSEDAEYQAAIGVNSGEIDGEWGDNYYRCECTDWEFDIPELIKKSKYLARQNSEVTK